MVGAVMALLACTGTVHAEDGYALWMRYAPLEPALAADYHTRLAEVVAPDQTPTQRAAREELERGLTGLTGSAPRMHIAAAIDASLVIGTPQSSTLIAPLRQEIDALGDEGYLLRQTRIDGRNVLLVAAPRDIGVLYGVFHLLRLLQTGASLDALEVRESPRMQLRVLNHWDTWTAMSNAATPVARCGTGRRCRSGTTRATPTTHAPTPRWVSTAPCSTT